MACASAMSVTGAFVAPVALVSGSKLSGKKMVPASSSSSLSKGFVSKLISSNKSRVTMSASQKEQNIAGLTGLALLAAAVVPEIAEAAQPGVSASLKNLLFSVVAGGVVLVAIGGAVAGVSTFDPVKRR
ncbi:hypothetical protein BDL97_05G080300 [Sphagnum fallax]|jgi:hypothetical protein|nr:hypothetical protein BDL97_05G080300 [Sphagnum fallax]